MVGYLDRYGAEDAPVAEKEVDIWQFHTVSFMHFKPRELKSSPRSIFTNMGFVPKELPFPGCAKATRRVCSSRGRHCAVAELNPTNGVDWVISLEDCLFQTKTKIFAEITK